MHLKPNTIYRSIHLWGANNKIYIGRILETDALQGYIGTKGEINTGNNHWNAISDHMIELYYPAL